MVEALRSLEWGGKTRCVRINDLRTRYAYGDILTVVGGAGAHLDTIMVPKVMAARDIWFVETLLEQLEADLGLTQRIGIEALIEEAAGMMRVNEIAQSSERLEALIFGMGDYSASLKMDAKSVSGTTGYPADLWHYARCQMIIAARAHGLDPIDGPFPDFRNADGYRDECRRALVLGCAGKWAIHPAQIPIALGVFTPPPEDVAHAKAMIAAYSKAEQQGLGSIQVDGQMVDVASVRILRNVLDRSDVVKP